MAESGPGDARAIENPTETSDMPEQLEEAVRSDADHAPQVKGESSGSGGEQGETVAEPGEGLVTEEGVNEPGTRAESDAPTPQQDPPFNTADDQPDVV